MNVYLLVEGERCDGDAERVVGTYVSHAAAELAAAPLGGLSYRVTIDEQPLMGQDLPGVDLILEERLRQIVEHGYDAAHDDEHGDGSLTVAAILIACGVAGLEIANVDPPDPDNGPWPDRLAVHLKQKYGVSMGGTVKQLTIAAAFLAAEIDRLKRNPYQ